MKKWGYLLVILCVFLLMGCKGQSTDPLPGSTNTEPIAVVDGFEEDVTVGSMNDMNFEISVPKGAFTAGTKVTIEKSDLMPKMNQNVMNLVGEPVSLTITGSQRRSDYPIMIKIKIDSEKFDGLNEFGGFKGIHYSDEAGLSYINPIEVNVQEGYILFEVYNNPWFGPAELTEEERKEQFIKNKALQQWGMTQIEGDVQQLTKDVIESILVEQFNAKNKSEIEAISKAVLAEMKYGSFEFGKLSTDLMNKDFKSYTANVATMVGKTFADAYENDTLTSLFGQTGTAAAAAGYLWEGDYSGAGMKLAEAISEMSPVYKVGKVAVEVIDMKINNWKANGIEEAYKAFKEGSNEYILFGYDNDPGDFESVYDQMRGVARQIEMDAVKRYAASIGTDVNSLSEEQKKKAIERVKNDLKEQFEKRSKQEDEIAKAEADQREVIEQFEKWGLLDKGRAWYPEDMSIEQMMTRMHNQILRIQKETGRFDLVYRSGDLHDQSRGLDYIGVIKDSEMLVSHLAELIKTRYAFGEEEYLKKLKEMGYAKPIELQPGVYKGILVITDAPIIDSMKNALENPESVPEITNADGEQCEEFDIDDEQVQASIQEGISRAESVVGVEVPLTVTIKAGENDGTYTATVRADYNAAFPEYECEEATDDVYVVIVEDNQLTLKYDLVEEGMTMTTTYKAMLSEEGKLEGTFTSTTNEEEYTGYASTQVLYSGTWRVSR